MPTRTEKPSESAEPKTNTIVKDDSKKKEEASSNDKKEVKIHNTADATPCDFNGVSIATYVGPIQAEYPCTHKTFNGTLYAGAIAVCFLGTILFVKWKILIKWENVLQVQRHDHGITILEKPNVMHVFQDMHNPDRVWSTLVSLHNAALLGQTTASPRVVPERSLRRMNSDPMRKSNVLTPEDIALALLEPARYPSDTLPHEPFKARDTFMRSSSLPQDQLEAPIHKLHAKLSPEEKKSEESTHHQEEEDNEETVGDAWLRANQETLDTCSVRALQNMELPMNLEAFFETFWKNKASFSLAKYMQQNGDADLTESTWKEGDPDSFHRVVTYVHPVNAPMAPPMAKARKEQSYRIYGDYGILLETKTWVDDVPMADCFYVMDRIRVAAVDGQRVSVNMDFDIRFVKRTMFRAIIASTTKSEVGQFLEKYGNYLATAAGDTQAPTKPNAGQPIVVQASPPVSRPLERLAVPLLLVVVIAQMWIVLQLRFMNESMAAIQMTLQQQEEALATCADPQHAP